MQPPVWVYVAAADTKTSIWTNFTTRKWQNKTWQNIYTELQIEMEFCLFSSHKHWSSFSGSCHVSHHLLVIHGLEDVVLPRAVVVAGTGLDEHHVLLHDLSIWAFELHGQGGGPVGGAAAAIQADTTELWPVGFGGSAARDLKFHGFGESGSANALFSFLQKENKKKNNFNRRSLAS